MPSLDLSREAYLLEGLERTSGFVDWAGTRRQHFHFGGPSLHSVDPELPKSKPQLPLGLTVPCLFRVQTNQHMNVERSRVCHCHSVYICTLASVQKTQMAGSSVWTAPPQVVRNYPIMRLAVGWRAWNFDPIITGMCLIVNQVLYDSNISRH